MRLRSDDQLVALFRLGSDEAFRTIHDRYRDRLLRYTRQMLGGAGSDAEDALQDVFIRAYGALRQDDRPITLRAWLYRVAHNRCVDQIRRARPAPAEPLDVPRLPPHDPTAEAEQREALRLLVCDVRRLPEQQRSALLMRELEGLSYAELADALAVSVPAVKSLLVRARLALVEAGEARDAACVEIREELALAFDRGVRASARSRRHMRDCAGCRSYKLGLRAVHHQLGVGGQPIVGAIAKLLGIGGAGSGVAVGGGAAVGGAAAGGTVAVGGPVVAAKVTALVCCGAAAFAGVADLKVAPTRHAPAPHRAPAHAKKHGHRAGASASARAAVAAAPVAVAAAPVRPAVLPAAPTARPAHRGTKRIAVRRRAADASRARRVPSTASSDTNPTGGALAPEAEPRAASVAAAAPAPSAPAAAPAAPSDPTGGTAAQQPAAAPDPAPAAPAPQVDAGGGAVAPAADVAPAAVGGAASAP